MTTFNHLFRIVFILPLLSVFTGISAQAIDCLNLPYIKCDSVYHYISAGEGQVWTRANEHNNSFLGQEYAFKFKASYSDELFITLENLVEHQGGIVILNDSLNNTCFDTLGFALILEFSLDTFRTHSLGMVEAGHTYYLLLDRNGTDTLPISIQLHCPDLCNIPQNIGLDQLGPNSAKIHWQNNLLSNQWSLEVRPATDPFTGTPTHNGTGNTFDITGLQPLTSYHWQVRNICVDTLPSGWSEEGRFSTTPDCGQAPALSCAQPLPYSYPGGSEHITSCNITLGGNFYNGPELYARFTPMYDGIYQLFYTSDNWWIPLGVNMAQIQPDCRQDPWQCKGYIGSSGVNYLNVGLLEADSTYIFAVEYLSETGFAGQTFNLQMLCPAECPVPTNTNTSNITYNTATAGWNAQSNQQHWEVLLLGFGPTQNDTFTFISDTPFFEFTNLKQGKKYRWRVRGLCDSLGMSNWSASNDFINLPDCHLYPDLVCGGAFDVTVDEGYRFFHQASSCSGPEPQGTDVILNFEIVQAGESRYLVSNNTGLTDNFVLYWRKTVPGQSCAYQFNWKCLNDSLIGQVARMRNLQSGTYEILLKKYSIFGVKTANINFYCDLPCDAPTNPYTTSNSGSDYRTNWTGGSGPWKYEVELLNAQGMSDTVIFNGPYQNNLATAFNLSPGQQYSWRVRKLCQNGALATGWSVWTRFQTRHDCDSAPDLACNDTASYVTIGPPHVYWNNCAGSTGWGQSVIYSVKPYNNGHHYVHTGNANGQPVSYRLTETALCNSNQGLCLTATSDAVLDLGILSKTKSYTLEVFQADSIYTAQTFWLECPCPVVQNDLGILQPDGSADLSWNYNGPADFEIELIPLGAVFSGVPNYFSNAATLHITGLNPAKDYQYRVRPVCPAQPAWSNMVELNHVFSCQTIPVLTCDAPVELYIPSGQGLLNDAFGGGGFYPGQERYVKVEVAETGNYSLGLQTVNSSANPVARLYTNCPYAGNTFSGLIFNGYTSVNLVAGQTYTLVIDNVNFLSGIYRISVCTPPSNIPTNDNAFDQAPWGNLLAKPVTVNAPCQVFSNRFATASNEDPNPLLPPGNWLDGPEKTVWFHFAAPAGGTVQVRVNSDSFDTQVALTRFDSIGFWGYRILASGENQAGSSNALLNFTGLIPGQTYLLVVDGVNGGEGDFCLEIRDEPMLSVTTGICQTFPQPIPENHSPDDWINFYADGGPNTNGPLLAAIQTVDHLGQIFVSTQIHSTAFTLPDGQKILPRYFNIETEFQPQNPVNLRLFFTSEDLAVFNLTPPEDSITVPQLGISHYDGPGEDCEIENDVLGGTGLPVNNSTYRFVGQNGLFYLETIVTQFSEFGAGLLTSSGTQQPDILTDLRLFPVPAADKVVVSCQAGTSMTLRLRLSHLTGKIVSESVWKVNQGANNYTLLLAQFPAGVYLLTVSSPDGGIQTLKIIKL